MHRIGGYFKKTIVVKAPCFMAGLLLCILMVTGSGCFRIPEAVPAFSTLPKVMDLNQMISDFDADLEAARDIYAGHTYLFLSVSAERVVSLFYNPRASLGNLFLQSGHVRFRPEYSTALDDIGPGFKVDVIGQVTGWIQGPYYIVDNCSYVIAEGGVLAPAGSY
jgi:hypothetical protein